MTCTDPAFTGVLTIVSIYSLGACDDGNISSFSPSSTFRRRPGGNPGHQVAKMRRWPAEDDRRKHVASNLIPGMRFSSLFFVCRHPGTAARFRATCIRLRQVQTPRLFPHSSTCSCGSTRGANHPSAVTFATSQCIRSITPSISMRASSLSGGGGVWLPG